MDKYLYRQAENLLTLRHAHFPLEDKKEKGELVSCLGFFFCKHDFFPWIS